MQPRGGPRRRRAACDVTGGRGRAAPPATAAAGHGEVLAQLMNMRAEMHRVERGRFSLFNDLVATRTLPSSSRTLTQAARTMAAAGAGGSRGHHPRQSAPAVPHSGTAPLRRRRTPSPSPALVPKSAWSSTRHLAAGKPLRRTTSHKSLDSDLNSTASRSARPTSASDVLLETGLVAPSAVLPPRLAPPVSPVTPPKAVEKPEEDAVRLPPVDKPPRRQSTVGGAVGVTRGPEYNPRRLTRNINNAMLLAERDLPAIRPRLQLSKNVAAYKTARGQHILRQMVTRFLHGLMFAGLLTWRANAAAATHERRHSAARAIQRQYRQFSRRMALRYRKPGRLHGPHGQYIASVMIQRAYRGGRQRAAGRLFRLQYRSAQAIAACFKAYRARCLFYSMCAAGQEVRHRAATSIQKTFRGFVGRKEGRRRRHVAIVRARVGLVDDALLAKQALADERLWKFQVHGAASTIQRGWRSSSQWRRTMAWVRRSRQHRIVKVQRMWRAQVVYRVKQRLIARRKTPKMDVNTAATHVQRLWRGIRGRRRAANLIEAVKKRKVPPPRWSWRRFLDKGGPRAYLWSAHLGDDVKARAVDGLVADHRLESARAQAEVMEAVCDGSMERWNDVAAAEVVRDDLKPLLEPVAVPPWLQVRGALQRQHTSRPRPGTAVQRAMSTAVRLVKGTASSAAAIQRAWRGALGRRRAWLRQQVLYNANASRLRAQLRAVVLPLQARVRGAATRKWYFAVKNRARALSIQMAWRMRVARRQLRVNRARTWAAIRIQARWRGYATRKRTQPLLDVRMRLVAATVVVQSRVRMCSERRRLAQRVEAAQRDAEIRIATTKTMACLVDKLIRQFLVASVLNDWDDSEAGFGASAVRRLAVDMMADADTALKERAKRVEADRALKAKRKQRRAAGRQRRRKVIKVKVDVNEVDPAWLRAALEPCKPRAAPEPTGALPGMFEGHANDGHNVLAAVVAGGLRAPMQALFQSLVRLRAHRRRRVEDSVVPPDCLDQGLLLTFYDSCPGLIAGNLRRQELGFVLANKAGASRHLVVTMDLFCQLIDELAATKFGKLAADALGATPGMSQRGAAIAATTLDNIMLSPAGRCMVPIVTLFAWLVLAHAADRIRRWVVANLPSTRANIKAQLASALEARRRYAALAASVTDMPSAAEIEDALASITKYIDPSNGTAYYFDARTSETSWTKPDVLERAGLDVPEATRVSPADEHYVVLCDLCSNVGEPLSASSPYAVWCCEECSLPLCASCDKAHHHHGGRHDHAREPIVVCSTCEFQTATRRCDKCPDAWQCNACYLQRHGVVGHSNTQVVALCVECEMRPCQWMCETCRDPLCTVCFHELHKGARRMHHAFALPYFTQQQYARHLQDCARDFGRVHLDHIAKAAPPEADDLPLYTAAAARVQAWFRRWKARQLLVDLAVAYRREARARELKVWRRDKENRTVRDTAAYKVKAFLGRAPFLASDTLEERAKKQSGAAWTRAINRIVHKLPEKLPGWLETGAVVRVNDKKSRFHYRIGVVLSYAEVFRTRKVRVFLEDVGIVRAFEFKVLRPSRRFKARRASVFKEMAFGALVKAKMDHVQRVLVDHTKK